MKIQAKLKDVVILPDEGNDYETKEIKRITEMVKDDPEAILFIKGQIHTSAWCEGMPTQFYLEAVKTLGKTKRLDN